MAQVAPPITVNATQAELCDLEVSCENPAMSLSSESANWDNGMTVEGKNIRLSVQVGLLCQIGGGYELVTLDSGAILQMSDGAYLYLKKA